MSEKSKLTIDQVALLAGVSRSVVSRVLNNQPKVSEEARKRVLDVVAQHGYRRSSVARSLATDRTFEVCIIAPRRKIDALGYSFWSLLHLGISEQCIQRGYFVSLTMVSSDTAGEINNRILNEHIFDGYILITQEVTALVAASLSAKNVPVVLIGHDPQYPEFNSIDVDNFEGAYQATTHLLELGHRDIGLILGTLHVQESLDRREGYLRALQEANVSPRPDHMVVGSYAEQSGYDIMNRWIDGGAVPSAVFCASDAIAAGVLLALYKAGIRVPDQVAVVGFDDVPGSQYTAPPLTTVHQPIYGKGAQAADIIINQIEGTTSSTVHIILPAELVVRESCGAYREELQPPHAR